MGCKGSKHGNELILRHAIIIYRQFLAYLRHSFIQLQISSSNLKIARKKHVAYETISNELVYSFLFLYKNNILS